MNTCTPYIDRIVSHYESITFAMQLVTASAALNIICWLVLFYAAWKLRKAAQNLTRAAQGIDARSGQTEGHAPDV